MRRKGERAVADNEPTATSVALRAGDADLTGHWILDRFGLEAAAIGDFAMGTKKHLAEITEHCSFAQRNASLCGSAKDDGENVEDVFRTLEGASGLIELSAERLGVGLFVSPVEAAVTRIWRSDGHATAAIVGGSEGTARSIGKNDGFRQGAFHFGTS